MWDKNIRDQRRDTYTQRPTAHRFSGPHSHLDTTEKPVDRTHGETKVATLSWLSSFGSRRLQFFAPVLLAIDRSNVAGPVFHTALSALASGDGGTAHAHPMGKWRRCGR